MRPLFVLLLLFAVAVPVEATTLPTVSSGTLKLHLSADTDVATSGSAVTSWADTGNGVSFTTATGLGTSPTLVNSGLNGKPVIRFNGTSDSLQALWCNPCNDLGDSFTLFIVTAGATNPVGLFESHPGGGNTARFYHHATPNAEVFELWHGAPVVPVTLHSSGSVVAIRANTSPTRSLDILEWSEFGAVTTSGSNASTTTISWANPAIGEIYNNVAFFNGDIAEVVIYDDVLSDADLHAVAEALAFSYGIVPEPHMFGMAAIGLLGVVVLLRRRRE